jgi:hypothetical protein
MDSMKNAKNRLKAVATPSICPCSVLNYNRASIDPSGLCLVATQAGRSQFRRIRIFQFFALISFFSVGFDGFDKSGALIFNNAPSRALRFPGDSQKPAVWQDSHSLSNSKGRPEV